ncbi:ParB/RepB/Spo0J family partition protein [Ancylobacter dichloromethanicus]|uniref:Chromosome partitioning protein ParB n=1 Tax=Ancylobacter dichloromethanicus TaxID=518825 RepID=A0A9W6JBN2_9HYPH|nr:ParB/RepB/Spo0J family partition protein [Ancylobacter dichloromethanicus]MBS7554929.1 ParB/RepB/Spo0J family partition protein [Ancylobacter dichloromethanicus]GLK73323.1 chromosome partitioning protein ParB [Ancylobacter dichloromethanicus]
MAMAEDGGRSRLGRGLAALIGDMGDDSGAANDRGRIGGGARKVPLAFLRPNPRNPRRSFAEGDLEDLAASIHERGIIQPIVVRQQGGERDSYEIVAGERRWRAAQRAGIHEVPVVVVEVDDREALEIAIIENVQRADLNPLEEAAGYQSLAEQFGYSQNDLARVIGKSRSHVANTMRLLRLPETVKQFLADGRLSAGHARALLTQDDPEALAQAIVAQGMNVRAIEALAQELNVAKAEAAGKPPKKAKTHPALDADTAALQRRLSDELGLNVTLKHDGEAGEIRIRYSSLDQLDEVCRRLAGS